MLSAFRNALKIPELRGKILFTVAIIAVYRLGSHLPVPGVDFNAVHDYLQNPGNQDTNGAFTLINLFSGGALTQFAIFALGIMPYITSSIIMQLLQVVIPRLEQLQKEGESGRKKIQQYTRYVTVFLALLQSASIVQLAHNKGILPLKVNQAGVIPIIFASSLLYIPVLLASIVNKPWLTNIVDKFARTGSHPLYIISYFVLIIFFAYFYNSIAFNPVDTADNMKKYGGFIPGIRPGRQTAEYLNHILTRI